MSVLRRQRLVAVAAIFIFMCVLEAFFPRHVQTAMNKMPKMPYRTSLEQYFPQGRAQFTCDRCLVNEDICHKFGTHNIDLSRAFDGTGSRVQRVLKRAMAGEKLTIGAMGGSISRGHGCKCVPWQFRVGEWFNQTFPDVSHKFVDGSVGARGSDYFKFCHHEHVPADEVDVVLLEMSVNDLTMDEASFRNFETLLRGVLSYPKKPAVIVLQTMQVASKMASGGDMHLSMCGYYDVPVISVRNWLLPKFLANYTAAEDWFNWDITMADGTVNKASDKLHPKDAGHGAMADLINIYLDQQLCFIKQNRPIVPPSQHIIVTQESEHRIEELPRIRLNQELKEDNFEADTRPNCQSVDSVKSPLVPVADQTKGFEMWSMNHHGEKKFWRGTKPGDYVTFEVVTTVGQINAYFLKSSRLGLGAVECWLDDNKDKKEKIDAYWDRKENIGQFQALFAKQNISPGKHLVHCEIVDKTSNPDKEDNTKFMFIGLFSV